MNISRNFNNSLNFGRLFTNTDENKEYAKALAKNCSSIKDFDEAMSSITQFCKTVDEQSAEIPVSLHFKNLDGNRFTLNPRVAISATVNKSIVKPPEPFQELYIASTKGLKNALALDGGFMSNIKGALNEHRLHAYLKQKGEELAKYFSTFG